MQYRRWSLASIMAIASLGTSFVVSGHELAKHIEDAEQREQIIKAFDQSEYLYGNAIWLSVYQGKVRLGGVVETAVNRDLAAQLALSVPGITAVDNKLVIESGYQPKLSLSERNYTQMAAQAVFNAKSFAQAKMDADLGAEEQEGWGVSDAWISGKVAVVFMYSNNINSDNISVRTRNGIVILRGYIEGGAEYALVITRIRNISGVKGINASDFSYSTSARSSSGRMAGDVRS